MRRCASILTLFSLVTLLLVSSGCGDKITRVGVILPESGAFENYGQAIRRGIELAVTEIAADSTYPRMLEVEFKDSESDPAKAAELLAEMYKNDVPLVIGGGVSSEALAMIDVVDRYNGILVSPTASSPELTQISSNFFRIYPSDLLEANRMALFARETLDLEKIAIVSELQQAYATGVQKVFREEFERQGGEVIGVQEYPPHTSDFSGIADWVMTSNPPGVYLAGYEAGVADMIRALEERGYEGKILTTAAFATPTAIARAGDAAADVLLTKVVFEVDSDHAHIKSFVTAYEEEYGERPDWLAAHGYDAMKLVAQALTVRTLIPSEIIKGLRGVKDFPGVTGSIQFDEKGDVKKFPRVYMVSKDLTLYNYDSYTEEQRKLLLDKRRELEERLRRIQQEAERVGDG